MALNHPVRCPGQGDTWIQWSMKFMSWSACSTPIIGDKQFSDLNRVAWTGLVPTTHTRNTVTRHRLLVVDRFLSGRCNILGLIPEGRKKKKWIMKFQERNIRELVISINPASSFREVPTKPREANKTRKTVQWIWLTLAAV